MRTLLFVAVTLFPANTIADPQPKSPQTQTVTFRRVAYDVVTIDPRRVDLRVEWKNDAGEPLQSFEHLHQALLARGERLIAATNAGIFESPQAPSGLLVSNGVTLHPLNLAPGAGNFFMLPNGVFLLGDQGVAIVESHEYSSATAVREATQSGPLLVRRGRIHPRFAPGSKNQYVRSGIGVHADGRISLVVSRGEVSFEDLAELFRDQLGCPDALYLDGFISKLYAPALGLTELARGPFAGFITVTEKLKE